MYLWHNELRPSAVDDHAKEGPSGRRERRVLRGEGSHGGPVDPETEEMQREREREERGYSSTRKATRISCKDIDIATGKMSLRVTNEAWPTMEAEIAMYRALRVTTRKDASTYAIMRDAPLRDHGKQ